MNIVEAMRDQSLFAEHFEGESWRAWTTLLQAAFGLPVDDMELFTKCTGRKVAPANQVRELWAPVGRRGGKSRIAAFIAVYLATFIDWQPYLAPGEDALVSITASDKRQAKVILRYIKAFLQIPLLAPLVQHDTRELIELSNSVSIEIRTASLRATRGYSMAASILDEACFYNSDEFSISPDTEIVNAIRPALATLPGSMLIVISSPYAQRGAMYQTFRDYYGDDDSDDILVWKAPSAVMNPTLSKGWLKREEARDPIAFATEYGGEFRSDLSAALEPAWIDAALALPELDIPPDLYARYAAFVDMSGGRSDSAALCIAHMDGTDVYADVLREYKPPLSPESVINDMAEILRRYDIHSVTGDAYAAAFTSDAFTAQGIGYLKSAKTASDLYIDATPLFAQGVIRAPDMPKLRRQLTLLERRSRPSGKDLITHPKGKHQHDDLANALAGAVVNAYQARAGSPGEVIFGPVMQGASRHADATYLASDFFTAGDDGGLT